MMRQYLLDDHIIFTPSDSSLRFNHEEQAPEESFLLPVPAARLLQVLLERSPTLITREELLEVVWEKYGMKGSMHNLAHYTMILRKAFSQMHMDKRVIVTVHKKGLMINPQIDIKIIGLEPAEAPLDAPPLLSYDEPGGPDGPILSPQHFADLPTAAEDLLGKNDDITIEESPPEKNTTTTLDHLPASVPLLLSKKPFYKNWRIVTPVILAAVIIAGLTAQMLWPRDNTRYSEHSLRLLTEIDRCKIYTFNAPTNDSILINDVLDKVKNFSATSKKPLNCKKDRIIVYYTDAFLGPNLTGKGFHSSLTLCTESKDLDDLSSCVSHYYN
ncbi:winged helix-turn-helix domain-containing protein [Enterobacter sp. DRP3]|nr:winged helix-turn-helix domain-containing protein [Enterobacter sp. DRP3]